jgi:hypothetical protein
MSKHDAVTISEQSGTENKTKFAEPKTPAVVPITPGPLTVATVMSAELDRNKSTLG